jgi:glucose-1-phosphate thymidylyltransferase
VRHVLQHVYSSKWPSSQTCHFGPIALSLSPLTGDSIKKEQLAIISLCANIKITNDGSKEEGVKLGAIGDIHFVLEKENIDDDVLIVAGDNLFGEPFLDFINNSKKSKNPMIGSYDLKDKEKVKMMSIINIDKDSKIIHFEEKPQNPNSTLIGIALYFYPKNSLKLIKKYIKEGNNPDQPGRLVEWLYKKVPIIAWNVPGVWFDVGTHESLKQAEDFMKNKKT